MIMESPIDWITAAKNEEGAGNIHRSRELINKGCEECPNDEQVWIEACRLASPDELKTVIDAGVTAIPDSIKLWMQALKLEPGDAKPLLQRAVERCPLHVELWLALARLETYDAAKTLLNSARVQHPKVPAIYISAAILEEETNGSRSMVEKKIIERGVRRLQNQGVEIDTEAWMKEAEAAERIGAVATCNAIIRNTIGIGVEEQHRKATWVAAAEECKKRGSIETARAIYRHARDAFPTKKSVWLKAAQLEKSHGTRSSLHDLLWQAVQCNPQAEVFWLMFAKEKRLAGDLIVAMSILQEAYMSIPGSEEIWLAVCMLAFENNNSDNAQMLLAKARKRGGTERVWMKSAIVERQLGNTSEERRLLGEGLSLFSSFFKLWLMLGQLKERLGCLMEAKRAYKSGLQHCPKSTPLWLSLANLEARMTGLSRLRTVLTRARKRNPGNPELWLAAVRSELRHGSRNEAEDLIAKVLQECPNSGILWAASIEMASTPQRKTKITDAYNKCGCDPHVIAATGKLFWHDWKVDKARTWLNRAVTLAPDFGDFWALLYKFELQHGTEDQQKEAMRKCIAAEPKHGDKWQPIAKAVENFHLPVEAILKKLVVALDEEEKA